MEKYTLSNEDNVLVSEQIEGFLAEAGVEHKSILRIRLAAEEMLLKYRDAFGAQSTFSFKCVKRFRSLRIEFMIPGERLDPFETEDEQSSDVLRAILSGMGIMPTWQYKNGANMIVFTPKKKKRSQMVGLALSIALAAALGGLSYLLPQEARFFIRDDVVVPVFNALMGLLSAVAGPIIFLSVAWGIFSIGDMATLGRIGKRMIVRFLVASLLVTLIACAIFFPFFQFIGSGGGTFDVSEMFGMILDIIPENLFAPFVENNPLQIIFIAVLIGTAMLILGNKTIIPAGLIEQSNYIIQLIMGGISSLLPVFVFCSVLNMMLGNSFSALSVSYKLLPLLVLTALIVMGLYACLICVRKKVKLSVLLKKLMPTFLIGLTTASSSAAYATNVDCCENRLGIDKKVVNIGIPLGQTVFMPGMCVLLLLSALCMAEVYSVTISPAWLVMAVIISIILAIAAPPVPGGMLSCYTILFLQLGIPAEGVAIMITLNIILDFISTAANLFCLQTELVELAGSIDMLDTEKLRNGS